MPSISLSASLRGQLLTSGRFNPLSIFAASEPGWVYDNSDMSTLFQDSAGTTPVTAVGQPVGLQLDKSKGLVLGPELVTNGDFSAGSTGWSLGAGWSISDGVASATSSSSGLLATPAPLTVGKVYRVTFSIVSETTAGAGISVYVGGGSGTQGKARMGVGTYTETLMCTTSTGLAFYGRGAGTWAGSIDNISVKELSGTHRTQSTAASRPTFACLPVTGRRNLLVNTPFAGAVAGSPGTIPTSWTLDINNATIALPSTDVIQISAVGQRTVFRQSFTVSAAGVSTYSCVVEVVSGTVVFNQILDLTIFAGPTYTYFMDGVAVTSTTTVPVGLHTLRVTIANDATSRTIGARLGVGIVSNSTAVVKYSNPQFEADSTATNYQKVVSIYNITEAGVQTAYGLYYDGVDDFMVTPTITPGTDKVQVFAGVRKLSDATRAMVVELGGGVANAFRIEAPNVAGSAQYLFTSQGTSSASPSYTNASVAAPNTSIITGLGDISGDRATLRINGTQVSQSTADQGTGNYLAYPVYFGRRGGTTLPFNGYTFREIGRFGPNLDAATIANVENWINQNTGAY